MNFRITYFHFQISRASSSWMIVTCCGCPIISNNWATTTRHNNLRRWSLGNLKTKTRVFENNLFQIRTPSLEKLETKLIVKIMFYNLVLVEVSFKHWKQLPVCIIYCFLFSGPTTMTRAAYARLSSAGFLSIVDRRGNPPQVIDPREELPLHLDTEGMDQLLGNEIIIQFLALSRYGRWMRYDF